MPNLIQLAIPGFLLLLLLEAIAAWWMDRDLFELKDTAASLAMGIGNVIIGFATELLVFGLYTFVHRFAVFHIGYQWWAWIALFFADDFSYYVFHRTSHECRFFWASHVVHHSSQRYNLGTALRQTWTGRLSFAFIFWLWLPLIGFQPMMIVTMQAVSLLYQFWIHTELIRSLGPLEAVFNTPSHHRVHHGSNLRYLDRNHAGTLIIWDRLFGTFEPEDMAEPPVYGLTKNIQTFNPVRIAFHEWIDIGRDLSAAHTWRERWYSVFGRPGWKYEHAQSSATASAD
ncbi:MAG TPA: sterol desaturase family protein [Terriglobales bacterium]|jgi:sterol desaturase/sphingolipid hydroxylase (fatty acid hydroxylase superfamily)|nr:sterol desaturase family protein [Terriglobales bacterium]